MSTPHLSPDQQDALQELTNVAIGRAGASLGIVLDSFVQLFVPHAKIVEAGRVSQELASMELSQQPPLVAVRQSFFNLMRGESLVVFGSEGAKTLAELMGYEQQTSQAVEQELLLDTSNLIVGAVLTALGEQLSGEFSFSSPEILAHCDTLNDVLKPQSQRWSYALLINISFALEARDFSCQMILLVPESSISLILQAVDQILADLS